MSLTGLQVSQDLEEVSKEAEIVMQKLESSELCRQLLSYEDVKKETQHGHHSQHRARKGSDSIRFQKIFANSAWFSSCM